MSILRVNACARSAALASLLVFAVGASDTLAQTTTASANPPILPGVLRPAPSLFFPIPSVSLTFDNTLLVPNSSGVTAADQIRTSHQIAQQQVRLALTYLLQNQASILAGKDSLYNSIFGNYYVTDSTVNPYVGNYDQTVEAAILSRTPILSSAFGGSKPILVVTGDQGDLTLEVMIDLGSDFEDTDGVIMRQRLPVGTRIYVANRVGNRITGGEAHTIIGYASDTEILLDSALQADYSEDTNAVIFRVARTETRPNPAHFNSVINTFAAIRNGLDQSSSYTGAFTQTSFDNVFGENSGAFPGLTELETILQRQLDRALRQDGYSHSPSDLHLADIAARTDPFNPSGEPPLLWVRDNELQTDLNGNQLDDRSRYYWGDVMTIYSDVYRTQTSTTRFTDTLDPNTIFVGPSFAHEFTRYAGDFLDGDTIGSPTAVPTPFSQWQMILMNFAEHGVDFRNTNTAAIGLSNLLSAVGMPDGNEMILGNRDAGNYARFADLFKDPTSLGGMFNPTQLEPWGKRAQAGTFLPAVPESGFDTLSTDTTRILSSTGFDFTTTAIPPQGTRATSTSSTSAN